MSGRMKNPAASARQRLLDIARRRGDDFQLVLARYGAERFLFRLGCSELKQRFVLKGAMLFVLWFGEAYRPTRDVDLLGMGRDDPQDLRAAIASVCSVPCPEDGLLFDVESISVGVIREDDEYGGLRAKFLAYLGKTRIPMQVDVGFGDAVTPGPREEEYPILLDQPPPRIRVYPRETMVAEKLEAMVRLGEANSRMKDFCDLAALAGGFDFEGGSLCEAVRNTFARRQAATGGEVPSPLRPAFYGDAARSDMWRAFLRGNPLTLELPAAFEKVGGLLISFLFPVWESVTGGGAFNLAWRNGGPWKPLRQEVHETDGEEK